MKLRRDYGLLVFILFLSLILMSCKEEDEEKIDAITEKELDGEVIHMDINHEDKTEELYGVIGKVNGSEVYLVEEDIMEIEGYLNAYRDGFDELLSYREEEGFSRGEVEEAVNEGFHIIYKSHIEEAIKDCLWLEDMVEDGKITNEETRNLSAEEIREITQRDMEKEFDLMTVDEEDFNEYVKNNQIDLIQYNISYLEFTNGENIDKINQAILDGQNLEEMKEFFTYGDDIDLDFDSQDVLYRRLNKINYDSSYNRQIIREKLSLIPELDEYGLAIGISDDMTKYRLLKLEDKQVDPSFIRGDLEELYKEEIMIKRMNELWDEATIEILISKESLFN